MDRGPQFPYEFKYEPSVHRDGKIVFHTVNAYHTNGDYVGALLWDAKDGEIQHVKVMPEHRGKGVAEGMLLHAKNLPVIDPKHSKDRSDEGNAWATKMAEKHGDELPPRDRDSSQGFSINYNGDDD